MRRGIDYEAATDRRGRPVDLGDRVSVPTYPRGSVRGIVEVSTRERSCPADWTGPAAGCPWALAVRADSGTLYGWSARGLLLRAAG